MCVKGRYKKGIAAGLSALAIIGVVIAIAFGFMSQSAQGVTLSGRTSTNENTGIWNYGASDSTSRPHRIHMIGDTWMYCVHDGPDYNNGVSTEATEANARRYLGQDLITELAIAYDYIWNQDLFKTPGGRKLKNDYERHAVMQAVVRAYCMRDGLNAPGAFGSNRMYVGKKTEGGEALTGHTNIPGYGTAGCEASKEVQKIYDYVEAHKDEYVGHAVVAVDNVNQEVAGMFWLDPIGREVKVTKTGTTGNATLDARVAANSNYDLSGAEFTLYTSKSTSNRAKNTDGETFVLRVARQSNGTYATNTEKIAPGTYYVRETKAPNKGYMCDRDGDGIPDEKDANPTDYWYKIEVTSGDNDKVFTFNWNNPPAFPKVQINKTGTTGDASLDERVANNRFYDLNGAQFTLYNSKSTSDIAKTTANTNAVLTVAKQADGSYKTNELEMLPGTYYVRETKAPNSGYQIDTDGDGLCDNEDVNPTDYWRTIVLPVDNKTHSINWNNPPFFPEVDLTKNTSKADMNLFEAVKDNTCYDILDAQFTLYEKNGSVVKDIHNQDVVLTVSESSEQGTVGKTNKFKILPEDYYLRETRAPNKGFYMDADGDGIRDEVDTNGTDGHKNVSVVLKDQTFAWTDIPMSDPEPLNLYKVDAETGKYYKVPQGEADLNGAEFRISYYKGVYTRIDQLPANADASAVWTTRSYVGDDGKTYSGKIDLRNDKASSGTWKFVDEDGLNYLPLGTMVMQEVKSPTGYLITDMPRIITLTDDGTHLSANIVHQPYQQDGTPGNKDWNSFLSLYQLNGDRDGGYLEY